MKRLLMLLGTLLIALLPAIGWPQGTADAVSSRTAGRRCRARLQCPGRRLHLAYIMLTRFGTSGPTQGLVTCGWTGNSLCLAGPGVLAIARPANALNVESMNLKLQDANTGRICRPGRSNLQDCVTVK
jgi:hypothetical protein